MIGDIRAEPDENQRAHSAALLRASKLQSFVFERELYEVFLLLDHISGRWDKQMSVAPEVDPQRILRTVCEIGLTPAEDPTQRVAQAVSLIQAKNDLNVLAQPASGLSVAFSILVIGEDDRRKPVFSLARLIRVLRSENGMVRPSPDDRRRDEALPSSGMSRLMLARHAYPGLIGPAKRFRRTITALVLVLMWLLGGTCALSWHVAAGNSMLEHLEMIRTRSVALRNEISAAEMKFDVDQRTRRLDSGKSLEPSVVRYCSLVGSDGLTVYRTTEEYQLCMRADALRDERLAVRLNLRGWLGPWQFFTSFFKNDKGESASPELSPGFSEELAKRRGSEEMARILAFVVQTTTFLPLVYGFLGAGAAIVRQLANNMTHSLLAPRDTTLAFLQLALGGMIGACISLFVSPSGPSPAGEHSSLGNWALSGSALAFLAGFGADGVFRALEVLVNRLFSPRDAQQRPPGHQTLGR